MKLGAPSLHQSVLRYQGKKYLWWTLVTCACSLIIYLIPHPIEARNGGTWQGYVLGTLGALLIVWLTLLGLRKRCYTAGAMPLQAWVSAHIYLGTSLLLVASLHANFQLGFNIHSIAYLLMLTVIISGFWGLWLYLAVPTKSSNARAGNSRADLTEQVRNIDQRILAVAQKCDADIALAVASAIRHTALGGRAMSLVFGRDDSLVQLPNESNKGLVANRSQQVLIDWLAQRLSQSDGGALTSRLLTILPLFAERQLLLSRIREDLRLHSWLKLWLYIHVPFSLGLLLALSAHVLSVFMYW